MVDGAIVGGWQDALAGCICPTSLVTGRCLTACQHGRVNEVLVGIKRLISLLSGSSSRHPLGILLTSPRYLDIPSTSRHPATMQNLAVSQTPASGCRPVRRAAVLQQPATGNTGSKHRRLPQHPPGPSNHPSPGFASSLNSVLAFHSTASTAIRDTSPSTLVRSMDGTLLHSQPQMPPARCRDRIDMSARADAYGDGHRQEEARPRSKSHTGGK